jgi:glycosyltransferase involved in cell wall biosynthesis
MQPKVSVILPVYNQEKFIEEAIKSVLSQTFTDFELLITDDGSTDNSSQIIKKFADEDKRIIPFFLNNAGKCNATNNLVNKAQSRWCAFLDADDVMLPDRLEKQVSFHLNNPEVQASSVHCYYINEEGKYLGVQKYPSLVTIEDCRKARADHLFIHVAFTGIMVLKNVYTSIGGLNKVFWPSEDFEFANRLIYKGHSIVIIQEVLMKYRIHSSSISAQSPLHMSDMLGYAMHCITSRRTNIPEISFEAFLALRKEQHWFIQFNRWRYIYAQLTFRKAGFAFVSKEYFNFITLALKAALLSPEYVVNRLISIVKR